MTSITLTIAFPTYNRKDAVTQRVRELRDAGIPEQVKILVSDNASSDGTVEALHDLGIGSSQFDILTGAENMGYAGNFLKVVSAVETDYILVCSDEDSIDPSQINAYIEWLDQESPDYAVPQAIIDGKVYRGRLSQGEVIAPEFQRSSFYISGLTFKADYARGCVPRIREILHKNEAALIYPQVLLAAVIIVHGRALWYPKPITVKSAQLKSHISGSDGEPYNGLVGRYRQSLGYLAFFDELIAETGEVSGKRSCILEMQEEVQRNMFKVVRNAVKTDRPDLIAAFDKGCLEYCLGRVIPGRKVMGLGLRSIKDPPALLRFMKRRVMKRVDKKK